MHTAKNKPAGTDVILDDIQNRAADSLDILYQQAHRRIKSWLRRGKIQGAYLWGEPGRGKTMLMNSLAARSKLPYLRIHYHQFLRDLHFSLKNYQGTQEDCLGALARRLAGQHKMLCLDEFHLHDVADAVLMDGLLSVLLQKRVFIVLTSNYAPENLLPDPVMHQHALPLITLIKQHMSILHLNGVKDYRYRNAEVVPKYLHPCGIKTEQHLQKLLADQGLDIQLVASEVTLCERTVRARATSEECIWFDFKDICIAARSHLDYLELSERWNVVIVSNIYQTDLQRKDGLRRFIWLIDVLYDRHKSLLLTSENPIEEMLRKISGTLDTNRTLSRLAEMQHVSFI